MNILSCFDGMSIAQQSLKELDIKVDNYYASEIDKYCIASTRKNFPNTIQLGDILQLDEFNLPKDINLLISGYPCQSFSIAGARKEFDDPRGQLFFEMMRVIHIVKPKYLILENVASMKKETQKYISSIIGVESTMIDASLVSAQSRKRLFWIAKLNDQGIYEQIHIPQPEDKGILLKDIIEDGAVDRDKRLVVTATYAKGGSLEHYLEKSDRQLIFCINNKNSQGNRVYDTNGKSTTLQGLSGGLGAKTGLYAVASRGRNIVNGKRHDELGAKTTQRLEVGGEKANTITSVQKDTMLLDGYVVRKLSPIECLRLQSLPDDYLDNIIVNNKPLSTSQKYKLCGNAFNCEVIKHIINSIYNIK